MYRVVYQMVKKSVYLDKTVNEAIEMLAQKYQTSFSSVLNEILVRALIHIDELEEDLKRDLLHKKHVEKRKRMMRILGFTSAMKKELRKVVKSGWNGKHIKAFLELWKEEAQELGILEAYKDAIRELYYELKDDGISVSVIEEELQRIFGDDMND